MDLKSPSHTRSRRVKKSRTERDPRALPDWPEERELETAPVAALLLFALCGGKGERHRTDPLVALAQRLADDTEAIAAMVRGEIDRDALGEIAQGHAERQRIFTILLTRRAA